MSSIIKGGRIRNEGIINLSERVPQKQVVEEIYEDACQVHEDEAAKGHYITSATIEEKRKELEEIEAQIKNKIDAANAKVDEILSQAYQKASMIQEDAKTQQTQMAAESYEKKEQILESAREEAAKIKEAALAEKQKMLEGVEGEAAETIITLVHHIISEELNYHNDWLRLVVKKMLQKLELDEQAVLYVSPQCLNSIRDQKDEMLHSLSKLADIKEDESLNDYTCRLVTSEGNIEYDVNQGLEKVISELRILKGLS